MPDPIKNIQNPQALAAGVIRARAPLGSVPGVKPDLQRAPSRTVPTRAPAAQFLVPIAPTAVVSGAPIPVRVVGDNPNRVGIILRSSVAGVILLYGGPGSRLPALPGSGVLAFSTESLTLETTDEVWVVQSAGPNALISGAELVSLDNQPTP